MEFTLMSDQKILECLASRFRDARLDQNMTQTDLADSAGIGVATLRRFERGEGNLSLMNMIALLKALGLIDQLDLLLSPVTSSPMSNLRNQGAGTIREPQKRQRASGSRNNEDTSDGWLWGDSE